MVQYTPRDTEGPRKRGGEACPSPRPITAELHDDALRLAGQHGFQIDDALIVAAALEAGCATLYTEDLQSGQVNEALREHLGRASERVSTDIIRRIVREEIRKTG